MTAYRLPIAITAIMTLLALGSWAQQPPSSSDDVKPLMHQKLDRAKNILEGLALEDYDKIANNARALKLLSLESGWNVLQTPKYKSESNEFRRSADLIIDAADEKDINRATLGYVTMTVRCVECHNYMRKNKIVLMNLPATP